MNPITGMFVFGFIWGFLVLLFFVFYLMENEMNGLQLTALSMLSALALLIFTVYTLGPGTMFLYLGGGIALIFFVLIGYHFEKTG